MDDNRPVSDLPLSDEPVPMMGVDWKQLLEDFLSGDTRRERPATDAFIGVITGTLRARGAYEHQRIWDDAIQDVLLKLFKKGRSVREPQAWVRQTTLNTFLDHVRKEATRTAYGHLLPQLPWIVTGSPTFVEETVVKKEEIAELRQAIERLPAPLRSLVEQVYPRDPGSEPDTQLEVAQRLGIQLHGVKNGLRRSLGLLSRELRRERNLRGFRVPHEREEEE